MAVSEGPLRADTFRYTPFVMASLASSYVINPGWAGTSTEADQTAALLAPRLYRLHNDLPMNRD